MTEGFWSAALDGLDRFEYGDVIFRTKPAGSTDDPRVWAETLFSVEATPWIVRLALAVRQAVVPLVGIAPRAPKNVFEVDRVVGDEAVISFDDRHLDFRCAVGVDPQRRMVRVTTVVRLHGWRGRVYFAPVLLAHPFVVSAMLARARRILQRR